MQNKLQSYIYRRDGISWELLFIYGNIYYFIIVEFIITISYNYYPYIADIAIKVNVNGEEDESADNKGS